MEDLVLKPYDYNEFQSIITPQSVLFFDMDGTLIETTGLNNYAYTEAFKNVMGYPLPISDIDRITRQTLQEVLDISQTKIEEIIAEKSQVYSNNLTLAKPISSTLKILETHFGWKKIYLVTRAKIERAIKTISHFGLRGKFTDIISSDADNKYKDAIERTGVDPKFVVAFENEDTEITAAIEAGILNDNIIKVNYGKFYNSTK